MGSLFKLGKVVLKIFELYCFRKTGFFRLDVEGTYISELAPKTFLKGFFWNFLGINTYKFVKNDPKFENKSLFDAKFYGAWFEKIFRSQSFGYWGLGFKN